MVRYILQQVLFWQGPLLVFLIEHFKKSRSLIASSMKIPLPCSDGEETTDDTLGAGLPVHAVIVEESQQVRNGWRHRITQGRLLPSLH